MQYSRVMPKYDGSQMPARDQRRTDPSHPPKPPGRKDKKRWCKGKVGVEHQWAVMVPTNVFGWDVNRPCRPSSYGIAGTDRVWNIYLCKHRIVCDGCGKALRRATQTECSSGVLDPA